MSVEYSKGESVFLLIGGLVLLWPSYLLRGFLGAILWRWFAVPLGMPSLSTWQAAGIVVLLAYFTPPVHVDQSEYSAAKVFGVMVIQSFFVPLVVFAAGYIVHWMLK